MELVENTLPPTDKYSSFAEDTMYLVENTHGLINSQTCRRDNGPCQEHARTKGYFTDLIENTSLHNPHTSTHVNRLCDFNCDFSEKKQKKKTRVTDSLGDPD